jgi:hypothetical protein
MYSFFIISYYYKKKISQISSVYELKTLRDALTKAEDSYIAFHIANVKQATFDVSVE